MSGGGKSAALEQFADELRKLRQNAGNPSFQKIAARTNYMISTSAARGR